MLTNNMSLFWKIKFADSDWNAKWLGSKLKFLWFVNYNLSLQLEVHIKKAHSKHINTGNHVTFFTLFEMNFLSLTCLEEFKHLFFIAQQLYSLGARKVIVSAVGQIGCIPYQLARYHGNSSRCNEKINTAVSLFNTGLRKIVDIFNGGQLPGAKFVYLDSYQSTSDLYLNASNYGNLLCTHIQP